MDESAQKIQPGSVCRVPYAAAGFGDMLTSDWAHGVPCAMQFFPPVTWQDVADEVFHKTYPRAELARTLEASGRELGAPEASLRNARLLSENGTMAVVTGQQAGFLGGPLYALHKALTAIALARHYEKEAAGEARFVPVFWVAGRRSRSGGDRPRAFSRGGRRRDARRCADRSKKIRRAFCERCVFVGRCRRIVAPARRVESIFRRGFQRLGTAALRGQKFRIGIRLAAAGMAWAHRPGRGPLERHAEVRSRIVVAEFARLCRLLAFDSRERRGDAQVRLRARIFGETARRAAFFCDAEPGWEFARRSMWRRDDSARRFKFPAREASFSQRDLDEKIKTSPELFSASAPLRPILQQTIFPVAAAVLGPGELAYWAQVRKYHWDYGAPWPAIVPRATLTLIDGPGEKAVRKLGLSDSPQAIFQGKEELARRAVAGGELGAKIAARTSVMLRRAGRWRASRSAEHAGVVIRCSGVRASGRANWQRTAEKCCRRSIRRGDAEVTRAACLAGWSSVEFAPQERIRSVRRIRGGKYPGLADRLLEIIEPDLREHLIVTL